MDLDGVVPRSQILIAAGQHCSAVDVRERARVRRIQQADGLPGCVRAMKSEHSKARRRSVLARSLAAAPGLAHWLEGRDQAAIPPAGSGHKNCTFVQEVEMRWLDDHLALELLLGARSRRWVCLGCVLHENPLG
jgi:hypothetical protein